jgi:hypothetical protein
MKTVFPVSRIEPSQSFVWAVSLPRGREMSVDADATVGTLFRMSDERLRELEQTWRRSGTDADRDAWLHARVRAGAVPSAGLQVAALCGDPLAMRTCERTLVPAKVLAPRLDVVANTLGGWRREGCPAGGTPRAALYDPVEVLRWLEPRKIALMRLRALVGTAHAVEPRAALRMALASCEADPAWGGAPARALVAAVRAWLEGGAVDAVARIEGLPPRAWGLQSDIVEGKLTLSVVTAVLHHAMDPHTQEQGQTQLALGRAEGIAWGLGASAR